MARRPHIDFTAVREMPISDIADQWYRELRVSREFLERELRLAVLNLSRNWREEGFIDPIPPDEELPPTTTRLSREEIWEFCRKQKGWPLPSFWFPPEPGEARGRGRPSHMDAILQELERRAEAGELETTVTEQAHVLNEWAVERDKPRMKVASVRDGISARYRQLTGQE